MQGGVETLMALCVDVDFWCLVVDIYIEICYIDSTLECMLDKSSRRYGIRGGWVDAVVCLHVEDEVMGPDRDAWLDTPSAPRASPYFSLTIVIIVQCQVHQEAYDHTYVFVNMVITKGNKQIGWMWTICILLNGLLHGWLCLECNLKVCRNVGRNKNCFET
jgi:hypothetical protein